MPCGPGAAASREARAERGRPGGDGGLGSCGHCRVGGAWVRARSGPAAAGRRRCGAGPRRAWVRLLVPFGCAGLGWFGKLTAMAAIGSVRARAGNRSCVLRVARCAGSSCKLRHGRQARVRFAIPPGWVVGFGRAPASIRWSFRGGDASRVRFASRPRPGSFMPIWEFVRAFSPRRSARVRFVADLMEPRRGSFVPMPESVRAGNVSPAHSAPAGGRVRFAGDGRVVGMGWSPAS